MPNCQIKKYDDLPGRVGWVDVDFLRFRLLDNTKKIEYLQEENKKITQKLEEAVKDNKKKNGGRIKLPW